MGNFRKTPDSIKNNKYSWLFASEWQMIHNRMDGNSFTFFIGANGSGKTFAALKRAEIIGVDKTDSYGKLFDPDNLGNHVFFDRMEMLSKIKELEKLPGFKKRGYQYILDEAQMTANAKDWNNKEVLKFSKEMTSIRSSRFSICLTMPTYKMITTDLRQLGTYLCEMMPPNTIDLENSIAYSKLHLLALKPYLGDVWRHRPYLKAKNVNPILKLPVVQQGLLSEFSWELPSKTTIKNYEKLKKEFRKRSSEKAAAEESKNKDKGRSKTFDYVKTILNDKDRFMIGGEYSLPLVMKEFQISSTTAKDVVKVCHVS